MKLQLTKAEQMKILKALSTPRKKQLKQHARKMQMQGAGFMDIVKSIGSFLGPVAKTVGPEVLKQFVFPWLKKQAGLGLTPSGMGLKIAGTGKRTKRGIRGKGVK